MDESIRGRWNWAVYVSLFLLSALTLAYEILLMRLFSIIHWYHFAYLVIGLALLGYGVSGSLISILQARVKSRFDMLYPLMILMFALSAAGAFQLGQHIPFNAETVLWDPLQVVYLLLLFLLLAIPFMFASSAICLVLMVLNRDTARVYAADLLGAGFGCIGVIVLLFILLPQQVLLLITVLGIFAASLATANLAGRSRLGMLVLLTCSLVFSVALLHELELKLSPYKGLSQVLRISDSRVLAEASSPMGFLTVVGNDSIPFRHAPGLSLNSNHEPLPQRALFTDGGQMSVITQWPDDLERLAYLDQMTSALAYHLRKPESVLVGRGGGGEDTLQAVFQGVPELVVLEPDRALVELVDNDFGTYSGRIYSRAGVRWHAEDIRDYLGHADRAFDLIQIGLGDAEASASAGLRALQEDYRFTTEAIELYLRSLAPNGYLSITRWVTVPPKDVLKVFNTVIGALARMDLEDIERRIMVIRGWQTATLIVRDGVFTDAEIQVARQFSRARSFDLVWLPGMQRDEANRFNRLATPMLHDAMVNLLSDNRQGFIDEYKFSLTEVTDDRPFVYHYFKWDTFTELFKLRNQGAMPLMEWGYLVLWAGLGIALLTSALLILAPLKFLPPVRSADGGIRRSMVVGYFLLIGLAFLMIEIAYIQKFTLLLNQPIYAVAVTLSAFLVFAGLGSYWSGSWNGGVTGRGRIIAVIFALLATGVIYLLLLDSLFAYLVTLPLWLRLVAAALLIAPLATLMGMPFPLALANLNRYRPALVPWAWAVNGFASVISASLATLLAINWGFERVILVALGLYLLTVVFFPAAPRGKDDGAKSAS